MARRETANMLRRKIREYEKLMDKIAAAIRRAESKHEIAMARLTAKLEAHSNKVKHYRGKLEVEEQHKGSPVQHWV